MQASKLDWIRRCAERFLVRHPALETDQAIQLAAALWSHAEREESPEQAADAEMAVWQAHLEQHAIAPNLQPETRH